MNLKSILFEKVNHIAKITLNTPETRNALNFDMRVELLEIFNKIKEDNSAKVIIITGTGKTFCSGGDLRTMEGMTTVSTRLRIKRGGNLIKTMVKLEKPIIAAINGIAAGAGVHLALACDILISSDKAKFIESFVKIGLIPDMGGYYFLPLRVGVARAKELMFTGELIDAREAERIGLINRVVPHQKLEEEAFALATSLSKGPSQSYAMIKSALNLWPINLESILEIESAMQAVAFSSEDFNEGKKAFLEKRDPIFHGE